MTIINRDYFADHLFGGLLSPQFPKDLFEDLNGSFERAFNIKSDYPYDIYVERDENKQPTVYNLNYALSGFKKDDISVKVVGDELRINVEKKDDESREYLHKGIARRNTRVTFKIGSMVDKKNITMKYEDGLLEIRIPVVAKEVHDVKFS